MKYLLIIIALLITSFFGTEYRKEAVIESEMETFKEGSYRVTSVIDGDTIIIDTTSGQEKVRLIGIDTPEVDPNRGGPECYGDEASKYTNETVLNKSVTIEPDESQGIRDKYGRLLAYVRLQDDSLLNQTLIAKGFAREYTYKKPYNYQKEFKIAETSARTQEKGLWGTCSN